MFNDYFNDYEEYLREPSEIDGIIEEMKDKLHSLITDEAKGVMNEYKKAKNELDELSRQVGRKRVVLNNIQEELKELEGKKIKAEKYDMPRKYIDAFVRDITGCFAPGDKVFVLQSKVKRTTCNKCNGEKKVKAIIGGEENNIECPKCKGYGEVSESYDIVEEKQIENVHLKLCFQNDRVGVWTSDSVYVKGQEYAVSPERIFKSREDAEKSM